MAKIAIIGAGGVIFAKNFINDILRDEELRHSEVVLMDIDAGRLSNAEKMGKIIADKLGVTFKPKLTTDLHQAVRGADYVITIFRSGTIDLQRIEYEIPAKYGINQVVGDTLGPGGVFRGLRTLKDLLPVVDAMEIECPGALLLNYVNPMSLNTIAMSKRAKTVKVIGLCHSVQGTAKRIAKWVNVPYEKLRYQVAGVNHQAFFLKIESEGKDLYPDLFKCLDNPDIYKRDKVRFELMRNFGHFPTESSGHGSEYIPYFRKRQDLLDTFCCSDFPEINADGYDMNSMSCGLSGASIGMCQWLQKDNEKQLQEYLSGKREIELKPSDEYGVKIISAVEKNIPISANCNVMNYGLIPTLPPECSVEVPCLTDATGVNPTRVDNYPEQLAALNRGMINVQILGAQAALTGDRETIFHAVAADPLTAAVLGLNEIRQMTNELYDALKDYI